VVLIFVASHLHGYALFVAGIGLGVAAAAPVALDALLPDHIAREQRGGWGEEMTARELQALKREGWVARHDIDAEYGNWDHVVAGRAVFLLDTKHHSDAAVELRGEALRVEYLDDPTESYELRICGAMKARAAAVSRVIGEATGVRVFVHPVVVLWPKFDQEVGSADGVTFVRGDKLAEWIARHPSDVSPDHRDVVAGFVRRGLPLTRCSASSD
jgi:hypothetical protein